MVDERLLDKKSAAEYLQISPRTLDRLFADGLLSKVKIRHKTFAVESELKSYVDKQMVTAKLARARTNGHKK